jgi:uncharacterized membrane protein YgdD (TMEM256/DUF423 family)
MIVRIERDDDAQRRRGHEMRAMNAIAALTGALALLAAAFAHHAFQSDPDVFYLYFGVGLQLSSAVACLAILQRRDRVTRIAMVMLLVGANMFAGETWAGAFHVHAAALFAPVGGVLTIGGWLMLAFAKPA